MKTVLLLLCALLWVPPACAAKRSKDWATGKLLSFGAKQDETLYSTPSYEQQNVSGPGTHHVDSTEQEWPSVTYTVVIQDGSMQYFGARVLAFRWQHDPELTENEAIRYRLQGRSLILLDDAGKEFKMRLWKRRIVP